MQNGPIKLLICGAGSRGRQIYGRYALERPDKATVVAVADPLPQRREALAQEHNIPPEQVFSDWRQALAAPQTAQVAVVATNDRDHEEPAIGFLEAGYHLLLEKPMAPTIEGCRAIVEAAERASGMSAVCHVLRYTDYFRKFKSLLPQVGQPITVRHLEPVNYWHFAHSFVRGNWRNSEETSPFILAKSCHDMDILLYLLEREPVTLQSVGALTHFREENAPTGSSQRCWDCSVEKECPYSARRFYLELLRSGNRSWPVDVLVDEVTEESVSQALQTGPYGRCVYHCDNDVCDHQVVQLQFEGGLTASFTATAFTDKRNRETEVLGTHGSLSGDGQTIRVRNFLTREDTLVKVESQGAHLGGDEAMLEEFLDAIASNRPERISTSPTVSLQSHLMALRAEEARLSRETVFLKKTC